MGQRQSRWENNRYYFDFRITSIGTTTCEAKWKQAFECASKLLFEATQGQLQLGELKFQNNGCYNFVDDIFLDPSLDASLQGTGQGDPKKPFYGCLKISPQAMHEPSVLVHEFGHYIINLNDEYIPATSTTPRRRTCQGKPSTHQCIMEYALSLIHI